MLPADYCAENYALEKYSYQQSIKRETSLLRTLLPQQRALALEIIIIFFQQKLQRFYVLSNISGAYIFWPLLPIFGHFKPLPSSATLSATFFFALLHPFTLTNFLYFFFLCRQKQMNNKII